MVWGSEGMIYKKRGMVICLPIPLNNFGHKMVTLFRILPATTCSKSLYINMGDTGLEPVTPCLSIKKVQTGQGLILPVNLHTQD